MASDAVLQALHRTAEDVRLEVDWRERQLAGLIGHLQHIASTQVLICVLMVWRFRLGCITGMAGKVADY